MNFGQAIKHVFSNMFNISGRARRSEYWWWQLFVYILSWVVNLLLTPLFTSATTPIVYGAADASALIASTFAMIGTVGMIVGIVFFILNFSVTVRRLHDTNRSGLNLFWLLLPLIGGIILLVFTIQDSTPGENRFGASPK